MHIREGMMQGEPLLTIAYGIDILLLIKKLKWELPAATQTCYSGDLRALGTFTRIEDYFHSLKLRGPGHGYYTEL